MTAATTDTAGQTKLEKNSATSRESNPGLPSLGIKARQRLSGRHLFKKLRKSQILTIVNVNLAIWVLKKYNLVSWLYSQNLTSPIVIF